jgi:hypothetical protein
MTTGTLPTPLHPGALRRSAERRLNAHAVRLLARWCASHFTRPLYSYRLGAFDHGALGTRARTVAEQSPLSPRLESRPFQPM